MKKSIYYFKEASKNNNSISSFIIGYLYYEVPQNLSLAIEYFNESIKITNDGLASYNLAHLYFYTDFIQNSFKKTIELLIESAEKKISPYKKLLSLVLIKTFGANLDIKEYNQ
ncbi:hypothetical protein M9Y10_038517 [Tritrichomonas musculus]|uniref:Uncharacterized protein n=1 Tax=Tritrichomonas musculus TaxID=1915356 RepID=A0ABR2K988_9EUKA